MISEQLVCKLGNIFTQILSGSIVVLVQNMRKYRSNVAFSNLAPDSDFLNCRRKASVLKAMRPGISKKIKLSDFNSKMLDFTMGFTSFYKHV